MTLITEPILGLEAIQRQCFRIFVQNLNAATAQINAFMAPRDQALDVEMARPYVPTIVEAIAAENFYEGHRPSLIDADLDCYPNLSVWAVRTAPAPESAQLDQMSISRTLLYVEIMCKAAPDEGEGILNRRVLRTVEGVNLVIASHPTLDGIVNAGDGDPTISISEVFTRKERTAYGPHWFWQGARIEFTIRKEAVAPTRARPSGSVIRSMHAPTGMPPLTLAAQPAAGIPGVPDFDYSQFTDQG